MASETTSAKILLVTTLSLLLLGSACDPEKIVNEYFAKEGLSRLAALRDDVEPGGLILVGKRGALYADNMFDYLNSPPKDDYALTPGSGVSEYNAVLKQYNGDRSMDANVALQFVQSIIPAKFGAEFKLSGSATIDMMNAQVRRMKIPTIQKFLARPDSEDFRKAVSNFTQSGDKAYLIYESWRTNKLKITTDQETNISPDLELNVPHAMISSGTFKFTYTRTTKTSVEISGDKFYVFAVRTAKLKPSDTPNFFEFDPMEFSKPPGWGILGAGGDDRFSAALIPNYAPVVIGD